MREFGTGARVLSLAAVFAVLVPLALTECIVSFTCDTTHAVFVLPKPGDEIVLRGRACVEGAEWVGPTRVYVLEEEGEPRVRLSIADPVSGPNVDASGRSEIEFAPVHCSEGLLIELESTASSDSPVTGVLVFEAQADEYDDCEVALEVP
jgi:hypothetical protein